MSELSNFPRPVHFGVRDRLFAMRASGAIVGLDDDGAALLADYSKIVSFKPGDWLLKEGETPEFLHILFEGSLRMIGGKHELVTPASSRSIGLVCVLADEPSKLGFVAHTHARALRIHRSAFRAALEENFSIVRGVFRTLASAILDARSDLPADTMPGAELVALPPRAPLTLTERAMELVNGGIFQGANLDFVFDVARILQDIYVPAGHVFWRRGDAVSTSLRIISGVVVCQNARGERARVGSQFLLGNLSGLAGRPHVFDAVAETDVQAYESRFEDFLVVLEAHPELANHILRDFSRAAGQDV